MRRPHEPTRVVPAWMLSLTLLLLCTASQAADESLHIRIDRLIESSHVGPLAPPASDAEFMRRVYLDLTGSVPTVDELRAFLDDSSPDKRQRLVDRLLASPEYARHMAGVFDIMLMERRADKHIKSAEWQPYLHAAFVENKPFDQLAREILGADGVDDALRPAVKFYLDRDGEVNLLTRDVGRIFLGMDLQCAQCHDHPLIDTYYQADYYGIYAFLNRGTLFTDDKKKVFYAEKADGDVKFKSVFTEEEGETRPRLPGSKQIDEPTFKEGEEYVVKPDKNVRPVPKYSRRSQLAKLATDGSNKAFNRNIANRLWAHMMGRGLVDPVDLHHADNPPTHAELLDVLADDFVATKFDIKAFLRELALSQTYQRSMELPNNLIEASQGVAGQLATLEADHQKLVAAVEQSQQSFTQIGDKLDAAEKTLAPFSEELATVKTTASDAKTAADEAAAALVEAQKQLTAKQVVATALADASASIKAAVAKLPEEKELAGAGEKFSAKAEAATAEVATLQKMAEERTAASKAMSEKLSSAEQAVAAVAAKHDPAQKQVADLREQLAVANTELEAGRMAVAQSANRIESAKQFVDYGKLLAAAVASRDAADKVQSELATSRQTLATLKTDLPKHQETLAAAQRTNDEAMKALTDAQGQLTAKQEAVNVVSEAVAKADAARQMLPEDAELAQAFEQVKTRGDQLNAELAAMQKTLAERDAAAKNAAAQLASAQKMMADATTQLAALEQRIPSLESQLQPLVEKANADRSALEPATEELTEAWAKRRAVATIKPLTPEQLAWSIMQVTGVVDAQTVASIAEFDKNNPPTEENKNDPAREAARAKHVEQFVHEKLKGNVAQYVNLFSAGAGQSEGDFFATVDQALFFANGGTVRGWIAPSGNNLAARAVKLEDPKAVADEIYMSVFTRPPTESEVADVTQYLATRTDDKSGAVQEIVWALITSTEFRFNH